MECGSLSVADVALVPPQQLQHDGEGLEYWRYCRECKKGFSAERSYKRHLKHSQAHNPFPAFHCSVCHDAFTRDDDRKRHERRYHWRLPNLEESVSDGGVGIKRSFADGEEDSGENKRHRTCTFEDYGQFDFDFDCDSAVGYADRLAAHMPEVLETLPEEFDCQSDIYDSIATLPSAINLTNEQKWCHEPHPQVEFPTTGSSHDCSELEPEYPIALPELSRGSSIESTRSTGKVSEDKRTVPSTTSNWTSVLGPISAQSREDSLGKHAKTKPQKFGTKCTICRKTYEADPTQLLEHLYQHLEGHTQEYLCEPCGVGFLHEADLLHHIRSAEKGSCGFSFAHTGPCMGHHPPSKLSSGAPFTDHDRFKLGSLLREWELSQLQLHEASVLCRTELQSSTRPLSRSSLIDKAVLPRQSLASLVYSLNSFRSEPYYEVRRNDTAGFEDLERRFGNLGIGKTIKFIRQATLRNKDLRADNEDLRLAAAIGDTNAVISALDRGANVDARGRSQGSSSDLQDLTPLLLASQKGHIDVVVCLLEHGAGINNSDSKGETALHKAVGIGSSEIVSELLRRRADTKLQDAHGHSALLKSIVDDQPDVTQLLLRSETLELLLDGEGPLLVHLAVKHNSLVTLQALLNFGIDANCRLSDERLLKKNSLVLAVEVPVDDGSRTPESSHLLEDASALYTASKLGHVAIVRMLLHAGARVDARGPGGTPLGAAVATNHVEVASALLSSGGNPFDPRCWGAFDAYFIADSFGVHDLLRATLEVWGVIYVKDKLEKNILVNAVLAAAGSGDLDLLQLALRCGADANAVYHGDVSPVGVLTHNGLLRATAILLESRNPTNECENGLPLDRASYSRLVRLAQVLRTSKTEPDCRNTGMSPLRIASKYGKLEVVKLLLSVGANPDLQGSDCCSTALGEAIAFNQAEIVSALLDHGVDPFRSNCFEGHDAFETAAKLGANDILESLFQRYSKLTNLGGLVTHVMLIGARLGQRSTLELALRYGLGGPVDPADIRVKLLLEQGTDYYSTFNNLGSPLLLASAGGHSNLVRTILTYGVNPNARKTSIQASPLHAAACGRSIDVLKALLDAGAYVDAEDAEGFTPLELALGLGTNSHTNLSAVTLLLSKGASTNRRARNGDGILVRLLANHQWALPVFVERLIDYGADVNDRNTTCENSTTPLYFAASKNWFSAVEKLVERGAAVNALVHGETASCLTDREGFSMTLAVLKANGGIVVQGIAVASDCTCKS